jgi:cytochrome P450
MLEPPGPRGMELFSAFKDWRKSGLAVLERLAQRYGDIVCVSLAGRRLYLVNHPEYIRRVLIENRNNYSKTRGTKSAQRYFGRSMQLDNGDSARRLRRIMSPIFQQSRVTRDYCGLVVEATRTAVNRWTVGPWSVPIQDVMDIALTTAVQIHFGTLPGAETDELAAVVRDALDRLSGFLPPDWLPASATRKYHAAIDRLDREVYARIKTRRISGAIGPDLLSCFVSLAGDGLTDVEIRNELLSMMAAGYTTVGIALNQTLREVASHPEIDDALHRETTEVLGRGPATYGHLDNLSFSEQVVKEALRIAPPAGAMMRSVAAEDEIGGCRIRPGSRLMISPWVTHRDARWFEQPLRFDPGRWTADFENSLPSCAYFPFGRGPRACMAGAMSLVILQLMLVTILQQYRLRTANPGLDAEARPFNVTGALPIVLEYRADACGAAPRGGAETGPFAKPAPMA